MLMSRLNNRLIALPEWRAKIFSNFDMPNSQPLSTKLKMEIVCMSLTDNIVPSAWDRLLRAWGMAVLLRCEAFLWWCLRFMICATRLENSSSESFCRWIHLFANILCRSLAEQCRDLQWNDGATVKDRDRIKGLQYFNRPKSMDIGNGGKMYDGRL